VSGPGRVLVTGASGFIGTWTCERLLADGWAVTGVDSLTDYYDPHLKREHLAALLTTPGFTFRGEDLLACDLAPLLDDVDAVVHLAGQPGVRSSWGAGFAQYVDRNVHATQRLLEAARDRPLRRFVYASSSSVYGAAERHPTHEDDLPRPVSPYGVTKLAAEHLCSLYGTSFGVPTVSLRYFTVFGPRQRPDMAMHRMIAAALAGTSFPLYGDGSAVRDFTYVEDVVEANVRAILRDVPPGTVLNIGGGSGGVTMREVIALVEDVAGRRLRLDRRAAATGDPARTGADITRARSLLGWSPRTDVETGLRRQVEWHSGRVA
jgi:UDP-glucuronate 4-epimerase